MQVSSGPSFPITNYLAPVLTGSNVSANGTVLKTAGTSAGVMQLPSGFTFMPGTRGDRGLGSCLLCGWGFLGLLLRPALFGYLAD